MKAILQQFSAHPLSFPSFLAAILAGEGCLYATNQDIAVRMPGEPFEGVHLSTHMARQIDGLLARAEDYKALQVPSALTLPAPIPCPACGGPGTVEICQHCHGKMKIDGIACPSCAGRGYFRERQPNNGNALCPDCLGHGETQALMTLQRHDGGPVTFARHYLAKLAALPELMLSPHPTDPTKPLYFAFAGGEGLLMPVRLIPEAVAA